MHRDEHHACPRCACALEAEGPLLRCARCDGTLIAEAELSRMIDELDPERAEPSGALPLSTPSTIEDGLICPRCQTTMTAHRLAGERVGRCPAHGLWFDRGGLQRVLEQAHVPAKPLPRYGRLIAGVTAAGIGLVWVIEILTEIW